MNFASEYVDRSSGPSSKPSMRKKYRGYFLTINPNIAMSQDNPQYNSFRDFFFYKVRQLFTRPNMIECIVKQGSIAWDSVSITNKTTFEYGFDTHRLHCHTRLLLTIPKPPKHLSSQTKVSISYKEFNVVLRKIFNEPEFSGIYCDIKSIDVSEYNLRDYLAKRSLRLDS